MRALYVIATFQRSISCCFPDFGVGSHSIISFDLRPMVLWFDGRNAFEFTSAGLPAQTWLDVSFAGYQLEAALLVAAMVGCPGKTGRLISFPSNPACASPEPSRERMRRMIERQHRPGRSVMTAKLSYRLMFIAATVVRKDSSSTRKQRTKEQGHEYILAAAGTGGSHSALRAMTPFIYSEPTWSNRFGRIVRKLQVVAIAGTIGAIGGGGVVVALVGGGLPRHSTVLKVSTTDNANVIASTAQHSAAHPVSAAPPPLQPGAAEGHVAQAVPPAAVEPTSSGAANGHDPAQQVGGPANSSAGALYNGVEPEEKTAPGAKAKVTRRLKHRKWRRHSASVQRAPPWVARGYYFGSGGGGFYDYGWGNR